MEVSSIVIAILLLAITLQWQMLRHYKIKACEAESNCTKAKLAGIKALEAIAESQGRHSVILYTTRFAIAAGLRGDTACKWARSIANKTKSEVPHE